MDVTKACVEIRLADFETQRLLVISTCLWFAIFLNFARKPKKKRLWLLVLKMT